MQELRLVGVSENGSDLLLADGEGARYTLAITDELRSTIRRDRREPASADGQAKQENPLRPRDVQALIRGGVTLEEIAERAGWPLEKVQRYEGPIRAERDYVSELAQRVQLFGRGEATTLRERADRRLAERGVEAERVIWDSWKNDDTHWTVIVRFPAGGRQREATWLFDPVNRALRTVDDEARWLGGDEIAAADDGSSEHEKTTARTGGAGRAHKDAPVYDVEAEGGLADAQAPHLGARMNSGESRPSDLTASMRARQASRGRAKGASAHTGSTTAASQEAPGAQGKPARPSQATQLPRPLARVESVERLDLSGDEPPAPSHPRPRDLSDDSTDRSTRPERAVRSPESDATPTAGAAEERSEATAPALDPAPGSSPRSAGQEGSRRRKNRRSRVEATSVRDALRTDDEVDQDESLFGELPGFHDGGDSHSGETPDIEDFAGAEVTSGHGTSGNGTAGDGTSGDDAAHDDAVADQPQNDTNESPVSQGSAVAPFSEDEQHAEAADDETSEPDRGTATSKGRRAVPERASQSRKSSRPSVPSWDDIMFGGRGPKK